ncbi:NTP transferase domain-containing protein [Clostridium algidicarnis]|uniref:NTP transferase domain-containing protein n=1 Tax=Clostridium algidicarnis TaxID=37659 RepID=UPI001C0AB90D|nr:NTP transferase domain-containing protein [Clostridium algidicarnis]MBU3209290.1 phosphotransferase [Clostridium algidicarnis]MBU3228005.1 phosphotransferase [Clostridium algidicarnis]MBU3251824.1 phosphotransferase [Clostridium algidicarnis]
MDEEYLRLLSIINNDKSLSQRGLSRKADISIGKINNMIKNLMEKEYVYVEKSGKKLSYILSDEGISLLEASFKDSYLKKIRLHEGGKKVIKQAVILAAGEREEFNMPIGMLQLSDETIIERILNILEMNGIKDTIIVAGYKSEYYEELAKKRGIKVVNNPKYKWTGTMPSLACAKDFIKDDFLLIESDLIFEDRVIEEVVNAKKRDLVVITNESGSGDEAFVEIRRGHLFKMSKDKHQLNKIDGEMIGVSKLSLDVFNKMMEEFKYNTNPYLNYEYSLLDVSRNYDIGYLKIDDIIWGEVDNKEHYEKMTKRIYPRIKRREDKATEANIKASIVKALDIDENEISNIIPSGGMTNKNYKVDIKDETYVLRIAGAGTDDMINRIEEKRNSILASSLKIDTEILCLDEVSGLKIAKFIRNAETLTGESSKKEENMKLTTAILKKLHTSGLKFENTFDVFEKIELYENLLEKAQGKNFEDYYEVKEKVMKLQTMLEDLDVQLLASHNDTVPENFVKNEERIYLIDWEYSGMNDPMWDLAAHSLECNFSKKDEELFLNIYFDGEPEEKFKKRVFIYQICQDFLWAIWTNIKEAKGEDFGSYGIDRYNRAKKNLELI